MCSFELYHPSTPFSVVFYNVRADFLNRLPAVSRVVLGALEDGPTTVLKVLR